MEEISLKKVNSEVLEMKKILLSIQEFLEDSFLTHEEETFVNKSLENRDCLISSRDLRAKLKL